MLIAIPDVLTPDSVARVRALIDAGEWIDGNATSGHQSALAKKNRQLAEGSKQAVEAGAQIVTALQSNALFVTAALPARIYPPLFNRYESGEMFGTHIDNAVRLGRDFKVRSDLSATLFLTDPGDYNGGELLIEDRLGAQSVKLPAGHMVVYPSSSLHQVQPVTRGERVSSFFWIQSMVRDDGARRILFDLDTGIRAAAAQLGHADRSVIELTGVYHNLLRRWVDV